MRKIIDAFRGGDWPGCCAVSRLRNRTRGSDASIGPGVGARQQQEHAESGHQE